MSDGPLQKSTRGVDSSPEAIAACVARLNEYHGRAGLCVFEDAAALLAQVGRERDEARVALAPFAAFADVLEPGDDEGKPWHSGLSVCEPYGEGDAELRAGLPDETPLLSAGSGWPKVPASYVTGLRLGDFRAAHKAIYGTEAHKRVLELTAAERQLAEARAALIETRKILKLLADFAEDAPTLDYNEDRVVTRITIVVAEARALLSGETT